ncbi:MAG: hypothetical protein A2286_09505 [Gammaproteobacteria bacterium RIFOXYA12_FULL_61_12]|nr:MAG: hypothetical protein A2286_09505 [Gammaproteobacteria bacterium RIFOXYA12_FULL_61_12]
MRYGYRNAAGAWIRPPLFREASLFMGKVARVNFLGQLGLIDPQGRWLTPAPPDDPEQLARRAQLQSGPHTRDGRIGLIDRRGGWVVRPLFHAAEETPEPGEFLLDMTGNNQRVRVDDRGRLLGDEFGASSTPPPREDKLIPDDLIAATRNGRWGVRDRQGKWWIEPVHAKVEVVSAQTAWVQSGDKWGLMDIRKGDWIVPAGYQALTLLNDGLVRACEVEVSGCIIYTESGRGLPDADIEEAFAFDAQGMAAVRNQQRGWGWVNRAGDWVIPPQFESVRDFSGEAAIVIPHPGPEESRKPVVVQADYTISGISLWPGVRLGAVQVSGGEYSRSGLFNAEAQWLLPRPEVWAALGGGSMPSKKPNRNDSESTSSPSSKTAMPAGAPN